MSTTADPIMADFANFGDFMDMNDLTGFQNFQIIQEAKVKPNGETVQITKLSFNQNTAKDLMKTLLDITDDEKYYNKTCETLPDELFPHMKDINSKVEAGKSELEQLAFFLADYFSEKIQQYEKMNEDGKITFDHLNQVFSVGREFIAQQNGENVASMVHSTNIETGMFGEKYFVIHGSFIVSTGKEFIQKQERFSINQFGGLKRVEDLPIRPITPEEKDQLTERGRIFKKYGLNTQYVHYKGNMFRKSQYGPIYFKADGRIMVDPIGFKTMNPNYGGYNNHEQKQVCEADLPDYLLYMTSPFITGFSLNSKQWGELFVKNISEIKFDEKAFEYLVLDEEKKELAQALITNTNMSFTDIITGKSGGCIFLLHGPPGVGKTLTCEAIAEHLRKPLYSITVGELGTTPNELEKKLVQILEIACTWDAVILIDEADIFLEKRTDNDIQRNAMVGIFLRLLERHQGVMFLTTNRENRLDEAFRSRISCIFKYEELTCETRVLIWLNLLQAANVNFSNNEVTELAGKYELNGRQIKNAIRMSQCLALSRKEELTVDHIDRVVKHM